MWLYINWIDKLIYLCLSNRVDHDKTNCSQDAKNDVYGMNATRINSNGINNKPPTREKL